MHERLQQTMSLSIQIEFSECNMFMNTSEIRCTGYVLLCEP